MYTKATLYVRSARRECPIKESYSLLRRYVNNDLDTLHGDFLQWKEIFRQHRTSLCPVCCVLLFFYLFVFTPSLHLYTFIVTWRDAFSIIYTARVPNRAIRSYSYDGDTMRELYISGVSVHASLSEIKFPESASGVFARDYAAFDSRGHALPASGIARIALNRPINYASSLEGEFTRTMIARRIPRPLI